MIWNTILHMFHKSLLLFLLVISTLLCKAQEKSNEQLQSTISNAYYLEIGGATGFGSINVEKYIGKAANRALFARMGVGTILLIDFEGKFNPDLLFPLGMSVQVLRNTPLFIGTGIVVFSNPRFDLDKGKSRVWDSGGYLDLGYRKQIGTSSWAYGVSWTPRFERWERLESSWFGVQVRKTW